MHHSHSPRRLRFPVVLHRAAAKRAPVKPQQHQQPHSIRAIAFHPEGGLSPMKKISGRAAILFAPTLIGVIYGMNFDVMPELHWVFGYPFALGFMLALAVVLYLVFKKKGWM